MVIITPPFAPQAWQNGRLRLIRLIRLVRVASLRRLLSLEGMKYAAAVAVGTVIVGGAVFASVEETDSHGAAISTWDGIWWAITTVTTVGYGDIYPESTAGRIIAIMLVGIGFVALLTAFIADRFTDVSTVTEEKEDRILKELLTISARLDGIERRLGDP